MSEAAAEATGLVPDRLSRALITASVVTATIMQSLDSTIANVALPRVQGELSATQDQMGWVLTSYIVASAIFIPLTGWLSNAVGKRRVLQVSIILFTATSVLCGLATNLPQLVFFRLLQGMGGAALVPIVATSFGLPAVVLVGAIAYLVALPAFFSVLMPLRPQATGGVRPAAA